MFKSYYVVWKHEEKNKEYEAMCEFKSYYVVWKPSIDKVLPITFGLFKSYYVVWKPIFCAAAFRAAACLNRTM